MCTVYCIRAMSFTAMLFDECLESESEKPCQRVSNADRKVLQIRKVFATSSLLAEEFPDILANVRILYKISRQYANCPDELESFRMIEKVSG